MAPVSDREPRPASYVGLVLATVLVGLTGFAGFALFPGLDLPAGVGAGLVALAAAAGVAAFFSPCSFGLLVTMLARPLGGGEGTGRPSGRAVRYASALSLGATAFLMVLGAVVALGGDALVGNVTFDSTSGQVLRIVVGAGLVIFGLVQLGVLRVDLRRFEPATHGFLRAQAKLRRRRPFAGFVLFGFVYLLAGFG